LREEVVRRQLNANIAAAFLFLPIAATVIEAKNHVLYATSIKIFI
jgi:hypothetical protein